MTLYLKNPIIDSKKIEDKIEMNKIAHKILFLNIENFITSTTLYKKNKDIKESSTAKLLYNYEVYVPNNIIEFYCKNILNVNLQKLIDSSDWIISLKFNLYELYSKGVLLKDIANIINESSTTSSGKFLTAIPYPNHMGIIEIFQNSFVIENYLVKEKFGFSLENQGLVNLSNQNYFITRDVLIPHIYSLKISGIENIKKVFINTDEIFKTNNLVIDTQGINLSEVLALDFIDTTKTVCDDMWSIYRCFGIEAARYFLIKEMLRILSFDGTYVNSRHVILLVDSMTVSGSITAISRDGIQREVGPLSKLMFEKPVGNITISASVGEVDYLRGTSSNIFMGSLGEYGCNLVKVHEELFGKDEPF